MLYTHPHVFLPTWWGDLNRFLEWATFLCLWKHIWPFKWDQPKLVLEKTFWFEKVGRGVYGGKYFLRGGRDPKGHHETTTWTNKTEVGIVTGNISPTITIYSNVNGFFHCRKWNQIANNDLTRFLGKFL